MLGHYGLPVPDGDGARARGVPDSSVLNRRAILGTKCLTELKVAMGRFKAACTDCHRCVYPPSLHPYLSGCMAPRLTEQNFQNRQNFCRNFWKFKFEMCRLNDEV